LKSFSTSPNPTNSQKNTFIQNVLEVPEAEIIIIEDESLMSALMQRYLNTLKPRELGPKAREGGIKLLKLESGWDLIKADLSHVQVAVVDILLPQITGVDLIRDFRKRYPNMGLVPVTGMATEPMKRSLGEILPEDFAVLSKPLRREDFIQAFLRAWQHSQRSGGNKGRPSSHSMPLSDNEEPMWSAGVSSSKPVEVLRKRQILKKSAA
jgi:DNA-binding NtrC family response regulator